MAYTKHGAPRARGVDGAMSGQTPTVPLDTSVFAAGSGAELTGIAGWIADVITALGAVGVGLLTLLEVVFPPIPSELVLPFSGYLSAQGELQPVAALVAATTGSVVGACLLYGVGAALGRERSAHLLMRIPLMEAEDLEGAEGWFHRHGTAAVLVGRLVPGARSFISLPAGIERMPLPRFVALTTVGSAIWNGALLGAGYALGRSWDDLGRWSDVLDVVIVAAVLGAVAKFVWSRRHRISRRGGGTSERQESHVG